MKNNGILNMTSECDITAAATKDGEATKLPAFTIHAYNGGVMTVGNWGAVVIDLAGMEVGDRTTILYGHKDFSVDTVLGQTSKIEKTDKLVASGVVMAESNVSRQVVALSKNGFKFQASVGAEVLQAEEVEEGDEREVNGKMLAGPYTLATKSRLREISVVPLGADASTETQIAAKQAGNPAQEKEMEMDKENKDTGVTADQLRAAAVAEDNRILRVREVAKDYPEISAQAVRDGWDEIKAMSAVKDAKIKALEAKIEADKQADERPKGPAVKAGESKIDASIIEAAVALRAGMKTAEKRFDADTLQKASELKLHSFTDLVRAALARSGKRLEHTRHETRDFLQAAFSTRDIANVLSNLANKFILEGYGTVEETWKEVAAVRSVVDFKTNTGVRLIMSNLLQALGPGGEISHGELSDETRTIKADTKGLMLGITREDIINDDLSVLSELPRKLGYAAARTFNTDFWAVLNAAAAEFTNARGNTTTGALTYATMTVAERLHMEMTDSDGNPIGAEATVALVSPTGATPARELYQSTNLNAGGSARNQQTNIFAGKYKPAISRYLTAAPWFLASAPLAIPLMQAAFLNGRQEPFVETSDADFNTLGIQMRCYFDYGVAFGNYRAAVRSTGV